MDNVIHQINCYPEDKWTKQFHYPLDSDLYCGQRYLSFARQMSKPAFLLSEDSLFCMERGDNRFQPMCCHYLSDSPCDDKLLGAEECRSPFGTYEISIPIDKKFPCKGKTSRITDENCKDFDVRELGFNHYKPLVELPKLNIHPLDPTNFPLLVLPLTALFLQYTISHLT